MGKKWTGLVFRDAYIRQSVKRKYQLPLQELRTKPTLTLEWTVYKDEVITGI